MDWQEIFRQLMAREIHLRPWEIRAMTIPEVLLALDGDIEKPRPPSGAEPLTPGYAERWRAMTPAERLERSRRKYG